MAPLNHHDEMISVVIPILNEELVLEKLYNSVKQVLTPFDRYEVIFINDGSTDRSLDLLRQLRRWDDHCKIIDFSRNFGHQVAITAGLQHAVGDAVIIMDGDLQDPPELIPELIAKWREGFEVVYAQRKIRKGENLLKIQTAKWFYRFINKWSEIEMPLDTGDFRLLDRKVVNEFNHMDESCRYIRGMVSWIGFKQTAVFYDREERFSGQSKYSFKKSLRLAWDGITSFSSFPISFSIYMGIAVALFFMIFAGVIVIKTSLGHILPSWSPIMLVILFLGSLQLISLGIVGQYIARIFIETKRRPFYVIRKKYGFEEYEGPPVRSLTREELHSI